MATFPLISILILCACLTLFVMVLIGGVALYFALRDRNSETAPLITSISDQEAEDFVNHFLKIMGHGNQGGDLMPLMAPSFVARARGSHTDLRVNKYSVGAVKIISVASPFVEVKISHHQPPRPRWAREQTYKLIREQGQIYVLPSEVSASGMIQPWWQDAPITRGQKLVFYLLDDPDQALGKATPKFKARYLNGKQDFVADMAPAMVVEETQAFLSGEYDGVTNLTDLSEKARAELQELYNWIADMPQSYIGYQIEK